MDVVENDKNHPFCTPSNVRFLKHELVLHCIDCVKGKLTITYFVKTTDIKRNT